jgi:hypothetical protein
MALVGWLLCHVGWHRWVRHDDEDGAVYLECSRCHTRVLFEPGHVVPTMTWIHRAGGQ